MALVLLIAVFCLLGSTSAGVVRRTSLSSVLAGSGKFSGELRALQEEKSKVQAKKNEDIFCAETDDLTPVCGTDGVTYDNPSQATCSGVAVAHFGPCPGSEPVLPPIPGPKSKRSDPKSKKTSSSCVVTTEIDPVCGSNGVTYINPSLAQCSGVSVAHDGACTSRSRTKRRNARKKKKNLFVKKSQGSAMPASLGRRFPDLSVDFPDFPDINIPDINIPDINIPDINIPDINIPDINIPDISVPDVSFPDFYPKKKLNKKNYPDISVPDVSFPDFYPEKKLNKKNKQEYSEKRSRDIHIPNYPGDIHVPDIPDINVPDIDIGFYPEKKLNKKNTQQYSGKRSRDIHIPNFRDISIPELHTRDFFRKKTETGKKKNVPFAQAVLGRLY